MVGRSNAMAQLGFLKQHVSTFVRQLVAVIESCKEVEVIIWALQTAANVLLCGTEYNQTVRTKNEKLNQQIDQLQLHAKVLVDAGTESKDHVLFRSFFWYHHFEYFSDALLSGM